MTGQIVKSLSGFFYVRSGERIIACRARGKIKAGGTTPLVGDFVSFTLLDEDSGVLEEVLARKNAFIRPAVANIDAFVFIASDSLPVTDPFLIDRVSVIAEKNRCEFILCINKSDLPHKESLYPLYRNVGFKVIQTSAVTGDGIAELEQAIAGKVVVFTGNSGIGKSSILNRLFPEASAMTAEISLKLNRGRHTTRSVQSYDIGNDTVVIDTPGFSSFDIAMIQTIEPEELDGLFVDFARFLGGCRFQDCRHLNEPGCAVLAAVKESEITASRHESYSRLYGLLLKNRENY